MAQFQQLATVWSRRRQNHIHGEYTACRESFCERPQVYGRQKSLRYLFAVKDIQQDQVKLLFHPRYIRPCVRLDKLRPLIGRHLEVLFCRRRDSRVNIDSRYPCLRVSAVNVADGSARTNADSQKPRDCGPQHSVQRKCLLIRKIQPGRLPDQHRSLPARKLGAKTHEPHTAPLGDLNRLMG